MSVAAQCASVVGCAGLVALYVAPSRDARLAGLVAWGAGLGVLGYTLLPDLSRPKLHGPVLSVSISPAGVSQLSVTGFPLTTLAGVSHSLAEAGILQ